MNNKKSSIAFVVMRKNTDLTVNLATSTPEKMEFVHINHTIFEEAVKTSTEASEKVKALCTKTNDYSVHDFEIIKYERSSWKEAARISVI
ncbi:hypothetical protein VCHA53O466_40219 [Vibrio chagasii]|nr:hypothetical protein VCHA53O466_40219 [Vibrio chagasii]